MKRTAVVVDEDVVEVVVVEVFCFVADCSDG